ncbi:hypothetical protein LIER_18069 [Lithospermum erythrorhizon]|uniref:Uncharacterized protein n=1 Tax=Lithospermum erythrorhizon TaxID=34254 RepID=A0AAV3QDN9_LITER
MQILKWQKGGKKRSNLVDALRNIIGSNEEEGVELVPNQESNANQEGNGNDYVDARSACAQNRAQRNIVSSQQEQQMNTSTITHWNYECNPT